MNKDNKLICVVPKYFVRSYNHISMYQLGYRNLSPITPPASTLGETASSSQVLMKGTVVRVLLMRFLSVDPGSSLVPTNGSVVGT